MTDLGKKTLVGFVQLISVMALLLFLPAWTLIFWQAWAYLLVFAVSTGLITVYLWRRDPNLLGRRVNAGPKAEKETSQKRIQAFASAAFIGVLILPSLDHRFSWSAVPLSVVLAGDVMTGLGLFIVFLVFRENTFTAATIEVAPDQRVVSTGLYAIMRHPMYSGTLIMLFGTPLALGSWWGLLMSLAMTFVIICRLLDEEKFLLKNLQGYAQYKEKVRYRLVPFLW